jgi:hypothetical protein
MSKNRTWGTHEQRSTAKNHYRATVTLSQTKKRTNKSKLSYKCFACIIPRVKLLNILKSPNNCKSTKFTLPASRNPLSIILWDFSSLLLTFSLIWFNLASSCLRFKVTEPKSFKIGSDKLMLGYLL